MFRYINMPKLVAFYLKEFSTRSDGEPSILYKFIFCLCIPFISETFNNARMIALAIAECTTSREQIIRLLNKLTGATITLIDGSDDYFCGYDGTNDATCTDFQYSGIASDTPLIPYTPVPNAGNLSVNLNGYSQAQFESYLSLLMPFYTNYKVTYI